MEKGFYVIGRNSRDMEGKVYNLGTDITCHKTIQEAETEMIAIDTFETFGDVDLAILEVK